MSNTKRRITISLLLLSYPFVGGVLGFLSELVGGGLNQPESGWGVLSAVLAGFLAIIVACILGPVMHYIFKNTNTTLSWLGYVLPGSCVVVYGCFLIIAALKT